MATIVSAVSGSSLLDINGETPKSKEVNPNGYYFIDWTKMSSVQDLVVILAAVGFNFSPSHPHFESIKPLLDLDNPVIPNQQ
jgi:hypothetical protein